MPQTTISDRVRVVREATGLTRSQFAALLNETAGRLGVAEVHYDDAKVRNMESAHRAVSLDDLTVVAFVDPDHRGRLWLGWGESRDSTLTTPLMSNFDSMSSEAIAGQRRGRGRKSE